MNSNRKKFIGYSFVFYMAAFYGGINLYLNDKLRAEMEEILNENRKKEAILEMNDRNALSYEKKTQNYEFRNSIIKFRRILLSYAKGKVLECGIGTGRSLEFYKDDCEIIGIDHSEKMLDQAKAKLESREHFNISKLLKVDLLLMDCENLNFEDDTFDTIVDFNNFHGYNDYNKVLKNIKRVLKDKGIFIFSARGESNFFIIRDFYKVFIPFVFMKHGHDYTINWEEKIKNDKDFKVLFEQRKNYGRTYLYILELNKEHEIKH